MNVVVMTWDITAVDVYTDSSSSCNRFSSAVAEHVDSVSQGGPIVFGLREGIDVVCRVDDNRVEFLYMS